MIDGGLKPGLVGRGYRERFSQLSYNISIYSYANKFTSNYCRGNCHLLSLCRSAHDN